MTTGALAVLAVAGCVGPDAGSTPEIADTTQAVSSAYFYDTADYMAPSCNTPVNLADPTNSTMRYVPVGWRRGLPGFLYVKDPTGKDLEEYTVGGDWIRLWTDTSWSSASPTPGAAYPNNLPCDEICGPEHVRPASCSREWQGTSPPQPYAAMAPRDVDNPALGAKFMPRYIPRDDANHEYTAAGPISAVHRDGNGACPGNTSWLSSATVAAGGTSRVRHVPSYRGWQDLVMKVVTDGVGKGDRFWYRRGAGFVGFEQMDWGSPDMSSTDPSQGWVSSTVHFATAINGQGTVFPGANRASWHFSQASSCNFDGGNVPVNRWIAIHAMANNQLVCADNFGNNPLIANRGGTPGDWEKFYVVDDGNGTVSLRANANQKYVSADNFGNSPLLASRPSPGGQWETYRWVDLGGNNFALQSAANGKYVTADNGGALPLLANRDAIGQWETFHWDAQ